MLGMTVGELLTNSTPMLTGHIRDLVSPILNRLNVQKLYPSFSVQTGGHPLLGNIDQNECPFKILPDNAPLLLDTINTKFWLSDFRNTTGIQAIHYNDEQKLQQLPAYDQIYFVVHGFLSNGATHRGMKRSLFMARRFTRIAVIVVDWSLGSDPFTLLSQTECLFDLKCRYDLPSLNTGVVGRELGLLAYLLTRAERVKPRDIHFIGFSLGAQTIHYAAQYLQKLGGVDANGKPRMKPGRLTALDPAAQNFQKFPECHVSKNDADFVDVYHTSAVESQGSFLDTLTGS